MKKYRNLIFGGVVCFIIINIVAIFIVFKQYHRTSSTSLEVSRTKLEYSELKKQIKSIQDEKPCIVDSATLNQISKLELEGLQVDSILEQNTLSNDELIIANQKLNSLSEASQSIHQVIKGKTSSTDKVL